MKRFFTLLLSMALASAAHAQFGFKAGLNAAVLDGTAANVKASYKTQYHIGALYNYKVAGPLSIQPELLYSLQGTERKSDLLDYDTKLHYLNLPVLAKVTLGPVFLEAGPQFGVLLTAKEVGTMLVAPPTPNAPAQYGEVSRQVKDNYKKNDFSLCAGLGFKLHSVLVGARFTAGLNDINAAKPVTGVNDSQLKNRVFQSYVAFQLGK
ncbi:porin family protein [Hymenobacter sp. GOD-10R]|uniref:porin family protein n=1 Tax=Hymenobacter sp. GOD-10R TaxID=3093922 RepID=UPI002D79CBE5|nr:porin family protein [Hymenobacter sp. GOD-10R]WRQ28235.1 porin family protein [Hymenobacter sp. GOD-10R]